MSDTLTAPAVDLPAKDKRAQAAIARAAAGQLLDLNDLAAIFGIGKTCAWQRAKAGEFDAFKAQPAIGFRIYSGVIVTRYLRGEALYEPTYGKKRLR